MSEFLRITDDYGNIPIRVPGSEKVYTDLSKNRFACYGIKLTGPNRAGLLIPTMGTQGFAMSHMAEWENRLKKKEVKAKIVHIAKGSWFPFCSDWGGSREIYWKTHDDCPEK